MAWFRHLIFFAAALPGGQNAGHDKILPLLIAVVHGSVWFEFAPGIAGNFFINRQTIGESPETGNTPNGVLCFSSRLQYLLRY